MGSYMSYTQEEKDTKPLQTPEINRRTSRMYENDTENDKEVIRGYFDRSLCASLLSVDAIGGGIFDGGYDRYDLMIKLPISDAIKVGLKVPLRVLSLGRQTIEDRNKCIYNDIFTQSLSALSYPRYNLTDMERIRLLIQCLRPSFYVMNESLTVYSLVASHLHESGMNLFCVADYISDLLVMDYKEDYRNKVLCNRDGNYPEETIKRCLTDSLSHLRNIVFVFYRDEILLCLALFREWLVECIVPDLMTIYIHALLNCKKLTIK